MGGSIFFKGGPVTERESLQFYDGGDYVTKMADSAKLGGPEHLRNFNCKWCILNQFGPSTKS